MGDPGTGEATVVRRLDDADRLKVQALLTRVATEAGFWPLSDQLAAELDRPATDEERRPMFALLSKPGDDDLAGYAQASRREGGWTMQVAVDPRLDRSSLTGALLDATLTTIDEAGGGEVDWWVFRASSAVGSVAAARGFRVNRDLRQMRRPLPAARRSRVETRSFVVGQDEDAWLAVNNRAFAGHAEQGGWTPETLRLRTAQRWFDPDGFRLHERDGQLAAFCWTKIHHDGAGEIYVIGVDPAFQGLGLGKELTLAGLDHMVDLGISRAMLYVDGANNAATALYEHLGFVVHRTDLAFRRHDHGVPRRRRP